jgi:glycosyltransferase involved in cell wall biosynthesis
VVENFLPKTSITPEAKAIDPLLLSRPVILGVGRLAKEKAFDRLIRAHAKLLKMGLDQHLVILGEGPKRTELLREAQRLGVAATTFLPGHVPNVPDWLERATIFALCSKYEGLPLVILEAMAAGTPIVAMDCPSGPREILQDGYAGLLVPEGDETAFTEALAALLTSPELRARYSERGKQRAAYYCPERIVPQWESLFKEIAGS